MKKRGISWLSVFLIFNFYFLLLSSCSIQKKIGKSAKADVLDAPSLQTAHVGISIFDPEENKYWYDYQGDKYFVPASNIKIPTCYAAMKYLGDSLVGLRYTTSAEHLTLYPNGDPTFLLPEFKFQPILDFLKKKKLPIHVVVSNWEEAALGSGWSWNDYQEYYMAERSIMPMYGNMIQFTGDINNLKVVPRILPDTLIFDSTDNTTSYIKKVERSFIGNNFTITTGGSRAATFSITFDTKKSITKLLSDTLKTVVGLLEAPLFRPLKFSRFSVIKTQPTDSVLKPMMHRSDNFFAEQLLLMVSNELLSVMDDSQIIDTLLKTDFKDLPHKPRWADGSGLSRYNLFSPQDFVAILNKMKNEFGMERLKVILPTGGEGTISSYYKADSGYIYGKTGTLSGVVAFSGFMYTKKGKLLIFSTLVNNHQATATEVRRAIEKFLQGVRNSY